jgi:hypothetical protein
MYQQKLATYSLNFGSITLLPKKCDVVMIQQYIAICLLNVRFKILTKVITNRIGLVVEKVIYPSQTAFLTGRHQGSPNASRLPSSHLTATAYKRHRGLTQPEPHLASLPFLNLPSGDSPPMSSITRSPLLLVESLTPATPHLANAAISFLVITYPSSPSRVKLWPSTTPS